MKRLAYFIRGINGKHEGLDWTDEAQYIAFEQTTLAADTYKYWSRFLANLFAGGRERVIAQDIREWQELGRVVPVMHSHGCELGIGAMRHVTKSVDEFVMIAAAVSRDCRKNGLLDLLESGKIKHVTAYTSTGDGALKWGGNWLGRLVGFGDFGRCTQAEINATLPPELHGRITVHQDNTMGHNDWITGDSLVHIVRLLEL